MMNRMFQVGGKDSKDSKYPQEVRLIDKYVAPDMEVVKLEMQLPLLSGESCTGDMCLNPEDGM